jgi:hypothetical protein
MIATFISQTDSAAALIFAGADVATTNGLDGLGASFGSCVCAVSRTCTCGQGLGRCVRGHVTSMEYASSVRKVRRGKRSSCASH